jgi:hypothetical protein
VFYDLKSPDREIASSKIKPLIQPETSIAPGYRMNVGGGSVKLFFRTGFSFKHTSGEVQYVRTNFVQPVNTVYMDHLTYSYTGIGVAIGPGIQFNYKQFGIGSEFHSEFSTGTYKGEIFYKDYYGNERDPNNLDLKNQSYRSKFINVYVSYAFGFGR